MTASSSSSRNKSTGPVLLPPSTAARSSSPGFSPSTPKFSSRFPTFFESSPTRNKKRTCMCSPSTHPGSFRCSLHKSSAASRPAATTSPYSLNRLKARRSAMTNSLVRVLGGEGDRVKRALAALIRPSSHQKQRRSFFRPRPSRLSAVSKASEY